MCCIRTWLFTSFILCLVIKQSVQHAEKKHKENLETATWLQIVSEDEPSIGEICNRYYICVLKGWSYTQECDTPVSLLIKVEIFVSALSFMKKKLFTRNAKQEAKSTISSLLSLMPYKEVSTPTKTLNETYID